MRRGYKIVCNTAAGRHRYMELLIPYVLSCDIVDRYDIWVNTLNKVDLRFFELLAQKYEKINLIYIDNNEFEGVVSIFSFYKYCTEKNTIYVKLDDDLIWLEPDAIKKMVDFRIDNPQYFIVSPLVINNCASTFLLQNGGKIKLKKFLPAAMKWNSGWCNAESAYNLLLWFYKHVKNNTYSHFYMGQKPSAMLRFSINMIVWFGDTFQTFNGSWNYRKIDDEEYFCTVKPTELGICNCINTDAIVTHFAFSGQRKKLDKTNILQLYTELLLQNPNEQIKEIYKEIENIIAKAYDTNIPITIPQYIDVRPIKKKKLKTFFGDIKIPHTDFNIRRLWNTLNEGSINLEQ